jgi:glucokinase
MPDAPPYALGIDVGVTNVKVVRITPNGELLDRFSNETNAGAPDWPTNIKRFIAQLENQHGPARGIGVAAPGIAAPDGACIAWMQGRLDAVQGLNWTEFLHRAAPVPILNDAQAALLGEAWIGAAKGSHDALLLTLGTGVGGALMVDGRLLRGHIGRAGHLGHITVDADGPLDIAGAPGSLESVIGNCTIGRRTGGRFDSTHQLIAAYETGDAEAAQVWLASIRSLAAALASLINVADPEVVVIGGGIARAGKSLFDPLKLELDRVEWRPHGHRVRIVPAELGEYAGAVGAARNALEHLSK